MFITEDYESEDIVEAIEENMQESAPDHGIVILRFYLTYKSIKEYSCDLLREKLKGLQPFKPEFNQGVEFSSFPWNDRHWVK